FGHVSVERIVSGPGLERVYEFFHRRDRRGAEPDGIARARAEGRLASAVSDAALRGGDPIASRALALFVSVCRAHASYLALTPLATGGVYVGGGIAPRIRSRLEDG